MPSESEKQRELFGIALGIKRGEVPASYSPEAAKIAERMSEEEIEDYARKSFDDWDNFIEKQQQEWTARSPFAIATHTAKKMGYKDFSEGSPGREKRDEIAEKLKELHKSADDMFKKLEKQAILSRSGKGSKSNKSLEKLNEYLNKGGPGSGKKPQISGVAREKVKRPKKFIDYDPSSPPGRMRLTPEERDRIAYEGFNKEENYKKRKNFR